jgi:GNAT superfamily N-acetyltransferase
MIEILPFQKDHLADAAALFIQNFVRLRQQIPILPDHMTDPASVMPKLDWLITKYPSVVALDKGRLVGYLGAMFLDHFRGTDRRAAYSPEWGHAALAGSKPDIYRSLYRAASAHWSGCQVHAITLLSHDSETEKTWFWNGFGLTVVDAIRSMAPIQNATSLTIRRATLDDVAILVTLEAEHWQHYSQPPVFMAASHAADAEAITELIEHHSAWLAFQGNDPVGYMRFEEAETAVLESDTTIANTGAYIRPAYRGQRVAVALLNAALLHYTERGFERCAVDFESFNPEAATFWLKHFEPVCLSVLRVPERI